MVSPRSAHGMTREPKPKLTFAELRLASMIRTRNGTAEPDLLPGLADAVAHTRTHAADLTPDVLAEALARLVIEADSIAAVHGIDLAQAIRTFFDE